jgi:hypothetical protein
MTAGGKALKACCDYIAAVDRITELTRGISSALGNCPEHPEYTYGVDHSGEIDLRSKWKTRGTETHLRTAYLNKVICSQVGHSGETKGWAEMLACPACSTAHGLIQERISARQTLGAAKRAIRRVAQTTKGGDE